MARFKTTEFAAPTRIPRPYQELFDRDAIDGIDVPDLFNLPPLGCIRRAYFRHIPEREPKLPRRIKHRIKSYYASTMEGVGLSLLAFLSKRNIHQRLLRKESQFVYLISSVLGTLSTYKIGKIPEQKNNPWPQIPVAVKVLSPADFHNVKLFGTPDAWIMEMQHHIYVWRATSGTIFPICPELGEYLPWIDIPEDKVILHRILEKEEHFWKEYVKKEVLPPVDWDDSDPRCINCHRRKKCYPELKERIATNTAYRGLFTKERSYWMNAYLENRAIIDKHIKLSVDIENKLLSEMSEDRQSTKDPAYGTVARIEEYTENKWLTRKLAQDHPELVDTYKIQTKKKRLTIERICMRGETTDAMDGDQTHSTGVQ